MPDYEGLKIKLPGAGGAEIDLNGTQWNMSDFDLGNPPRRDEFVTGSDADGSRPARVARKDNREVTATLQLANASGKDDALTKISALEAYLEQAEAVAAEGPVDPINYVRFIYTPAGGTKSFSLLIYSAEITGIPKTPTGDDAGWFIDFPQITIHATCDPFGYGALRTYLDTTTTAAPAPSVTVAGGPGDVTPWIRTAVKDVAATSRGLVRLGVKRGESSTTAQILASAMTPVNGTYSAPNLTLASPSWAVMGTTARQTRTGTFRVYAHRTSGEGIMRLAWAEAGGSLRRNDPVATNVLKDVFLGVVTADTSWDIWIEGIGFPQFYSLILVPVDSFVEVTGAAPGEQLVGATVASDGLQTTSTHIGGRTMTLGGSWTTVNASSPTWPVSAANWARRTAVSMATPAFAQAGTTNYMNHEIRATTYYDFLLPVGTSTHPVVQGVYARYVDASNYLALGSSRLSTSSPPVVKLVAVVAGIATTLWTGRNTTGLDTWRIQIVDDGRWAASYDGGLVYGGVSTAESASGQSPLLVSGSTLGNSSAAKAGLIDFHNVAGSSTRDYKDFSIKSLVGITPAPIPSGSTLKLAGPSMYNADLAEYPYTGSSGLALTPGVNNNLTVMAQRSSVGHASTSTADTPALDIDIDGYPRYLSVPH